MPSANRDVIAMGQDPIVPIDMVFTWVDGTDAVHVRERRRCEARYADVRSSVRADARPEARFEQVGEIVASVNSVLSTFHGFGPSTWSPRHRCHP